VIKRRQYKGFKMWLIGGFCGQHLGNAAKLSVSRSSMNVRGLKSVKVKLLVASKIFDSFIYTLQNIKTLERPPHP
jgi:hypothetical protein